MKRHVVQTHKKMSVCACKYFGPSEVMFAEHLRKCEAPIETKTAAEMLRRATSTTSATSMRTTTATPDDVDQPLDLSRNL